VHINSYYYLGLGVLSLVLLLYIFVKKGLKRSLLLFIAMVGLGYIIEAFIYNLLASYQYYPKLLHHDEIYDSNLGAIASNALALPVAATFIANFRKGFTWILFFISLFAAIEWMFLKLHIYSHNWWRIEYTSLGLPFYFLASKWIYKKMLQPLNRHTHSIILFLIIGTLSGNLHIFPIMFFSNRVYQPGFFENLSQDTTAFAAIFYLCASAFYVTMVKLPWKNHWIKYVLTVFFMYVVTMLLRSTGLLLSLVWWDMPYYLLISIILIRLTVIISKHLKVIHNE
jgi:hypothetical protein